MSPNSGRKELSSDRGKETGTKRTGCGEVRGVAGGGRLVDLADEGACFTLRSA